MENTCLNIPGCYAAEAAAAVGASRSLDIAGNIDRHRRVDLLIDENNVERSLVGAAVVMVTSDPFYREQTVNNIQTHLTLVHEMLYDLDKSTTSSLPGEVTDRAVPSTISN
jgi:hypothetical protein